MIEAFLAESLAASFVLLFVLYSARYLIARISNRAYAVHAQDPPIAYNASASDESRAHRDTSSQTNQGTGCSAVPVYFLILIAIWWVSVARLEFEILYLLALGALSAVPLTGLILEIRQAAFHRLLTPENHSGRLVIAPSVAYSMTAYQYVAFMGVFAVMALITLSWFLCGIAVGCLFLAVWSKLLSMRVASKVETEPILHPPNNSLERTGDSDKKTTDYRDAGC